MIEFSFRSSDVAGWRGLRPSPLEYLDQRLAEAGRRRRHPDARRLHGGDLGFGVALAARDDRAGVAHAAADDPDHRLLAAALGLIFEELGGVLLGRAADFADHDDRLRLRIGEEHL